MKLSVISLALAGVVGIAMVSEASAWTRTGSVSTPRGTYYRSGAGGCAGGTCSHAGSVTGPYGGTASRAGSVTRTGPGSYNYSRTTTGPYGNSVTRSGSVSRY